MQAAAALPSRSSYASSSPVSPVQSMAPTTTQIALMHEMQSSMMKQISRLQGNVHHLSQQLRESRDKHEMLERQMVALRNVQQPQSRPRIPERLPGSPLPFSRNSAAERSPPPTLHSRSSGATSSFALPPPAALASFNPGERYHPYRQHSSDRPRGNFALPPLRDIDPDVRTGRRSPIEALSPWRS
ncbi:hypothetical protein HKX48_007704 [Thoreauomyces humboldtii]|nr:hypothetical protein HKX48_007704 [Thoreauomyces humboldtii]